MRYRNWPEQIALHPEFDRCYDTACTRPHQEYVLEDGDSRQQGYRDGYLAARTYYGEEAAKRLGQIHTLLVEFQSHFTKIPPPVVQDFLKGIQLHTQRYAEDD